MRWLKYFKFSDRNCDEGIGSFRTYAKTYMFENDTDGSQSVRAVFAYFTLVISLVVGGFQIDFPNKIKKERNLIPHTNKISISGYGLRFHTVESSNETSEDTKEAG